MKLCVFVTFLILLSSRFGECNDSLSNRTLGRSRYSWRNRYTTTESEKTTTNLNDITTTLGPMEVIVESQNLKVVEPKSIKFGRDVSQKIKAFDNTLKCGERLNNDAPWIAIIEHKDPTGRDPRKTISKGVLISNKHVLTTVSSIHNTQPFWVATRVRLGDYPTWINKDIIRDRSKIVSVEIDKVYQHPSKDIAIITLKDAVAFGDFIQPMCLPVNTNYNHSELYLHFCKKSKGHDHLKHHIEFFPVKSVSPQDCTVMFHRKGAVFTESEFCAWDEFGDTCTGDIGGPLMAKLGDKYIVIGLNSYALTDKEFDATDYPGVYVNVGYHIKWIDDIISITA